MNALAGAALAGALLAGACQARARSTPSAAPSTAPPTAPPTTSRPCPSPAAPGDTVESIVVGTETRSYRLSLPAGSGFHPLILLFHGSGADAATIASSTSLPARAARLGYVVATPDAVNHNWQVSLPNAGTADLRLVATLVASLESRFCIDAARVYAAGFSLGSEFAAIVACAPGPPFAAIGMVSAEFLLKPCSRPVPAIAFHGTVDPLVPYQDGAIGLSLPGMKVRGVENNLGDWALLDGCAPIPVVEAISAMVIRRTWPACTAGSSVVLYTVVGGGHAWPGPPLDATGRILEFFAAHRADPH